MAPPQPPPVSSPLTPPGTPRAGPPVNLGAYKSQPKFSKTIKVRHARRHPSLTAGGKHTFRFTDNGMELVADKGRLVSRNIPAHVVIEEYLAACRRRDQDSSLHSVQPESS
ncbi:hypothetical protein VP01_379g6 [Puccinia sorghi]|uniref:Uncharacterized protein n=1 Tax=Puccinia sorghi TaxID=27349 RepID=A0A0L6UTJ4_9BASI|nr:hypothetical protein VP01_379g6 [Puccinia sorghi]